MINKILNFLYFKNYFRLAIYFSKFFSLFDNKIKKRISFYNYFKKKKKICQFSLHIPSIYNNFPNDADKIINQIYNYEKLYKANEFSNDGHLEVYQSEHNLNENLILPKYQKI